MTRLPIHSIVSLLIAAGVVVGTAQDAASAAVRYQALDCPPPMLDSTWALLNRDGAHRNVERYLSSLGQGESGTGVVTSPPFVIASDTITFTIRGHDGQGGGQGKNYIALVDVRKGKTRLQTPAPGNDALQDRSWDVATFRGMEVRIEVHDGDSSGAYAWLGIGRIDASPALKVDFRGGIPDGWMRQARRADVHYEVLNGGIPFRRDFHTFSLMPKTDAVELPCGFAVEHLFLLGCTVAEGRTPLTYGAIELHYQTGEFDTIPLICGVTLDAQYKRLNPAKTQHLHPSSDPYQPYLVITPRNEVIEKIRLVTNTDRGVVPRITAITCETSAVSDHLTPLPECRPSAAEANWITSHAVSLESLQESIQQVFRAAERRAWNAADSKVAFRKIQLDAAFRSEGVAVADFNADGRLDIAAGNVYYAGPDWKTIPMLGEPQQFAQNGYSDAFLCFPDDLDGDGDQDLIVVGFPNRTTHWLQNPGRIGQVWNKYLAVQKTGNESPAYVDIDGDGRRELLFMTAGKCVVARPGAAPTQLWPIRAISRAEEPTPGHGLGVGDVNGDGRRDVLTPNGWWEGPLKHDANPWRFHVAEFFGGAQLCVADFDGDGDNDVLGSSAHGHGITWTEQTSDGWQSHAIDASTSQTHALRLADINQDGLIDFVTGKRYWAHNSHDPGSYEPAVLQWFELTRQHGRPAWIKRTIDTNSGVGLHLQIVDVDGDGLLDIVTSSKKGVYYFQQVRQ